MLVRALLASAVCGLCAWAQERTGMCTRLATSSNLVMVAECTINIETLWKRPWVESCAPLSTSITLMEIRLTTVWKTWNYYRHVTITESI